MVCRRCPECNHNQRTTKQTLKTTSQGQAAYVVICWINAELNQRSDARSELRTKGRTTSSSEQLTVGLQRQTKVRQDTRNMHGDERTEVIAQEGRVGPTMYGLPLNSSVCVVLAGPPVVGSEPVHTGHEHDNTKQTDQ